MKQSPRQSDLQNRLHSSKFSGDGFLGTDTRPVEQIVEDDARFLDKNGLSTTTIADALEAAYGQARASCGGEVQLRPGVSARFFESMGRIPSPFRGDGVFEKGEALVADAGSGRSLRITALGISLIRKHGFFQGLGSAYRIEPAHAMEILGIADTSPR